MGEKYASLTCLYCSNLCFDVTINLSIADMIKSSELFIMFGRHKMYYTQNNHIFRKYEIYETKPKHPAFPCHVFLETLCMFQLLGKSQLLKRDK